MIKLANLAELQVQPGERSKMKNFLYRGTKQQIAQANNGKDEFIMEPYDDEGSTTYSKQKGTIEGKGMLQVDKPYNKRRTVGWEWDELNTLEEMFISVRTALLGRELQTLEDVKKIIARLKERGFSKKEALVFILKYLNQLDEVVGYATIIKPSVSGGLTQDTKNIR